MSMPSAVLYVPSTPALSGVRSGFGRSLPPKRATEPKRTSATQRPAVSNERGAVIQTSWDAVCTRTLGKVLALLFHISKTEAKKRQLTSKARQLGCLNDQRNRLVRVMLSF